MATDSAAYRRREGWLIGALVAFAAAVRILRWQGLAVMFNDGPIFLALAEAIESGLPDQALAHPFHPLYSALVAAFHGPIASWELAAVLVSVLCGSLAVGILYLFVRELHDPTTAWIAALLFAVHPLAIEYTGDIQSEGTYLLFFLSAAYLLWRALGSGQVPFALGGGLAAGFAYLTRPEGLGIALVAGGLALVEGWRNGRNLRRSARLALAMGLGGVLVVGPYVAFLHGQTGEWTFTQKKSMAGMTGLEAPPRDGPNPILPTINRAGRPAEGRLVPREARRQARLPEENRPSALTRYADALFDVARTHLRALRYEGVALLLAGLALGGIGRAGPRARFIAAILAAYAVVLLLLAANVGYVSGRHALPPLVLTFGYVAAGVVALRQWTERAYGAVTGRLALVAVLLLVIGIGLGKALTPDRVDSRAERIAAEWLGAQDLPVRGLGARKRRIAYYAGAPFVKIHAQERSAGKIWTRGASHLILGDDADHYPLLRKSLPTEAVLVHRIEAPAPGASVYELPMPERFRKRQRYRERNLIDAGP